MVRLDSDGKYTSVSLSARLRRQKAIRSSPMPRTRLPVAATKTCAKEGMHATAVLPREDESVGTSRQPRTESPSSAAISSIRLRVLAICSSSPGRKAVPTAYARLPGRLEVDDLAEELVGDLHQDARAVTGVRLGAGGTAVLEVAERRQRLADDLVARDPGHGGHEGDAARVVLVGAVVETLGSWPLGKPGPCRR